MCLWLSNLFQKILLKLKNQAAVHLTIMCHFPFFFTKIFLLNKWILILFIKSLFGEKIATVSLWYRRFIEKLCNRDSTSHGSCQTPSQLLHFEARLSWPLFSLLGNVHCFPDSCRSKDSRRLHCHLGRLRNSIHRLTVRFRTLAEVLDWQTSGQYLNVFSFSPQRAYCALLISGSRFHNLVGLIFLENTCSGTEVQ